MDYGDRRPYQILLSRALRSLSLSRFRRRRGQASSPPRDAVLCQRGGCHLCVAMTGLITSCLYYQPHGRVLRGVRISVGRRHASSGSRANAHSSAFASVQVLSEGASNGDVGPVQGASCEIIFAPIPVTCQPSLCPDVTRSGPATNLRVSLTFPLCKRP